jgi:hypothetical protein
MALSGETMTTASAALKERYVQNVCQSLIPEECPVVGMMKKDTSWDGKSYLRVPVIYSSSAGISSSITVAKTSGAASSLGIKEFQVTRGKIYSIGYIQRELLMSTKGTEWYNGVKPITDNLVVNVNRALEVAAFRNGYGIRGRIKTSSTVTGTTITLADPADAFNFETGFRLDLTAEIGTSAAKKAYGSSGNPLIITGIDTDAGTLTVGYNLNDATNGVPTISASGSGDGGGDYIVLAGDVSTTMSYPCGFGGWIPATAPGSSDSFFGLNRSVAVNRLAGQRLDLTSTAMSLIEGLNKGVMKSLQYSGKPTHCFTDFSAYNDMVNSLEGRVRFDAAKTTIGGVGFSGIKVKTAKGDVEVYPSIGCPSSNMFMVDMNAWTLMSVGPHVAVVDEDGLVMLRVSDEDAYEMRFASYCNFYTPKPSVNVNVKLS